MGDKNPKSKAKEQKQDIAQKSQKQAAANAKAHPVSTQPLKSGKPGK